MYSPTPKGSHPRADIPGHTSIRVITPSPGLMSNPTLTQPRVHVHYPHPLAPALPGTHPYVSSRPPLGSCPTPHCHRHVHVHHPHPLVPALPGTHPRVPSRPALGSCPTPH
eukprot:1161858-Pelagomonas_calceolata.AAC.8